jgi:Cu2+-exporting ATPase
MIMPMLAISCISLPFGGLGSFSGLLMSIPAYKMRYLAPASLLNYLNIAAREGILVKACPELRDGRSLELIMEVDTLVFDKTGTAVTPRMFGDLGVRAGRSRITHHLSLII